MENTRFLTWACIIGPKIEIGRPGRRWTDKWVFGTIPIASSLLRY